MSAIDLAAYTFKKKSKNGESTHVPHSKNTSLWHQEIELFKKGFTAKAKEGFYSELGLMLSAGVDIISSFDIIASDITDKHHKELISSIKNMIISGKRFSDSVATYPKIFSAYEIQSIVIGEETGKLPEILQELSYFYTSSIKLRRQIIGVLTYPVVVIGVAILIVYFMLCFVVPIFTEIFSQTGGQLPGITLFLIKISEKSGTIFWLAAIVTLAITFVHRMNKKKTWYRSATSSMVMKLPVVNILVQKIYLARFCQSMKLLTRAKILSHDALGLVKEMIDYYPMELAIEQVKKEVIMKGKQLNEGLAMHKIFPKKLVALIKISEEVNEPEIIFDKMHAQYSAELEHQQAVVGKLIEPFFIVILGLIIGFILLALYMPMFEMSSGTF